MWVFGLSAKQMMALDRLRDEVEPSNASGVPLALLAMVKIHKAVYAKAFFCRCRRFLRMTATVLDTASHKRRTLRCARSQTLTRVSRYLDYLCEATDSDVELLITGQARAELPHTQSGSRFFSCQAFFSSLVAGCCILLLQSIGASSTPINQ
jgi:hypothetical protein